MDKQTIKDIIAKGLAGQGNQLDISGKLATVLDALTDATPMGTAKLTAKVYAYAVGDEGVESDENGCSGVLYVKGFTANMQKLETQEIPFTIAEGESDVEIEVDANIGDTIALTAKIADKGASCQIVTKVVSDVMVRLEVYPAGLYEIDSGAENLIPSAMAGNGSYEGVAIVTEDFAMAWPKSQRANYDQEYKRWGAAGQKTLAFTTDSAEVAKTDFDGALNTEAIKAVIKDMNMAAYVGLGSQSWMLVNPFLPSAGMLRYLYEHKTEINAFIEAEETAYSDTFGKIPDLYCWSSTDYENDYAEFAWYVGLHNGNVGGNRRRGRDYAVAVSAFTTFY